MEEDQTPDPLLERRKNNRREEEGDSDRRDSVVDRRSGAGRRGRNRTGLERLRGPGRRRSDFARSAEEGEMNPEQYLFVMAIDAFKRVNRKPFPTWTEVLEVIRKLGYRKTVSSELKLPNAEDWTEAPDAPAMPEPPTKAAS
ncbi:MAG: hypothetical protein OER86_01435 [Phycisphaerae bacterium]|nr:hypothetical protein [Phycisphaerae bacterium]